MDPLFECRNSYYLGNFAQCVNAANTPVNDPVASLEIRILLYRSLIAQKKYNTVLGEISNSEPTCLQLVKQLTLLCMNPRNNKDKSLSALDGLLSKPDANEDSCLLLAACIYYICDNIPEALQLLHNTESLDNMAMMIQCLLKINRPDEAKKYLTKMCQIDDDASITQLATAWIHLAEGGEKYNEAFYIFKELGSKYGFSSTLLNGQAVCCIHQGDTAQAEELLNQAQSKDGSDMVSLSNLLVIARQGGKSIEVSKRILSTILDDGGSDNTFAIEYQNKMNSFDQLASAYN